MRYKNYKDYKNAVLQFIIFGVVFVLFGLIYMPSKVNAQNYCTAGPNDYCYGSSVIDIPNGCSVVGGVCTQNYSRVGVTCDSTCSYKAKSRSKSRVCNLSSCTSIQNPVNQTFQGSCCVNLDDPPPDEDPTADTAYCGTTCATGVTTGSGINTTYEDTALCSSAGLVCDAQWTAADNFCNQDQTGENCFRVCGGDDCYTPADYVISGRVTSSDDTNEGVSDVPIIFDNGANEPVVTTTDSDGYWQVSGLVRPGPPYGNDNWYDWGTLYQVESLWTKNAQTNNTSVFAPNGFKGTLKTVACDEGDKLCRKYDYTLTAQGISFYNFLSNNENVPAGSTAYYNQRYGYYNGIDGAIVGNSCGDTKRFLEVNCGPRAEDAANEPLPRCGGWVDKSGRCDFVIDPAPGMPTNLNVTRACTQNGLEATFTWDKGINNDLLDYYILRINYDNSQDGDSGDSYEWINDVGDWWLRVPETNYVTVPNPSGGYPPFIELGTGTGLPNAAGSCDESTCSVTLPSDYRGILNPDLPPGYSGKPGAIEPGDYISWSVTPVDVDGDEITSASAISYDLTLDSCTASISGTIKQDTCDVGAPTLTGAWLSDPNPVFDSTYTTPGWSSDGTYSLTNIPFGATGALCADYQRRIGLVQFTLACINGDTSVGPGNPCITSLTDTSPISSDLTDVNIGYAQTILQPKAWFSAYNGDVYGRSVAAEILDPLSVGAPYEPYIGATTGLNNDSVVFGQIAVNSSEISENGKYADNFPSNTALINANNINFNPPTDAVELDRSDNLNNLDPSNTYVVGVNDLLDIMSPTYSLSSDGVAVIYVLADEQDPDEPLAFDTTFTTSNSARRILFISQAPIQISPSVVSPSATIDFAVIQAGLISNKDIVFETFQPTLDDIEVVVEGPIIAINGADATVDLKRDLGATNNLYLPSTTVLYNSIYLTQVPKDTGIEITDVSWRIIE